MKKIKLLTSALGIGTLAFSIIPTISSCSTQTKHAWITELPEKNQKIDDSVNYLITLDSDNYKTNDINVNIIGDNTDALSKSYIVSGNILILTLKCVKDFENTTTISFNIEVSTSKWKETIEGCSVEIEGTNQIEITEKEFYLRYQKAYLNFVEISKSEETQFNSVYVKGDLTLSGRDYDIDEESNIIYTTSSSGFKYAVSHLKKTYSGYAQASINLTPSELKDVLAEAANVKYYGGKYLFTYSYTGRPGQQYEFTETNTIYKDGYLNHSITTGTFGKMDFTFTDFKK